MSPTAWPPDFDIHTMFGPDLTPPPALDWNKIQAFARFALDSFIGQIAIAFGGINILGWKPFDFLADWGQQRIAEAQANYLAATNAQGAADYANSQITGLLTTDVSGGVALYTSFDGPAATDIGANFTQVYSGPGGGTWGVDGAGNTRWNASGGGYRICTARHNTPVTTNYQRIRVVLTSKPWSERAGQIPANFLYGRMNAAGDSLVYARFTYASMQVGCIVAGSTTVFATVSFSPNLGDVLDFYIGTDDDDREFIVRRNGVDIVSCIDSAAVSDMGSSNLYVGLGAMATDRDFFTAQSVPGQIAAWAGIDRQATTH